MVQSLLFGMPLSVRWEKKKEKKKIKMNWPLLDLRGFAAGKNLERDSVLHEVRNCISNSHFEPHLSIRTPHYFSCICECDKNRAVFE